MSNVFMFGGFYIIACIGLAFRNPKNTDNEKKSKWRILRKILGVISMLLALISLSGFIIYCTDDNTAKLATDMLAVTFTLLGLGLYLFLFKPSESTLFEKIREVLGFWLMTLILANVGLCDFYNWRGPILVIGVYILLAVLCFIRYPSFATIKAGFAKHFNKTNNAEQDKTDIKNEPAPIYEEKNSIEIKMKGLVSNGEQKSSLSAKTKYLILTAIMMLPIYITVLGCSLRSRFEKSEVFAVFIIHYILFIAVFHLIGKIKEQKNYNRKKKILFWDVFAILSVAFVIGSFAVGSYCADGCDSEISGPLFFSAIVVFPALSFWIKNDKETPVPIVVTTTMVCLVCISFSTYLLTNVYGNFNQYKEQKQKEEELKQKEEEWKQKVEECKELLNSDDANIRYKGFEMLVVNQEICLYFFEQHTICDKCYEYIIDALKKYSNENNPNDCLCIGVCYNRLHDNSKAMYWYQKGAENGDSRCMRNLGYRYKDRKDMVKAYGWFKKAANQGEIKSYYELGCMYRDGIDGFLSKDIKKAKELWKYAADNGNKDAQEALERIYPGE